MNPKIGKTDTILVLKPVSRLIRWSYLYFGWVWNLRRGDWNISDGMDWLMSLAESKHLLRLLLLLLVLNTSSRTIFKTGPTRDYYTPRGIPTIPLNDYKSRGLRPWEVLRPHKSIGWIPYLLIRMGSDIPMTKVIVVDSISETIPNRILGELSLLGHILTSSLANTYHPSRFIGFRSSWKARSR